MHTPESQNLEIDSKQSEISQKEKESKLIEANKELSLARVKLGQTAVKWGHMLEMFGSGQSAHYETVEATKQKNDDVKEKMDQLMAEVSLLENLIQTLETENVKTPIIPFPRAA
jgi:hypothetical protein